MYSKRQNFSIISVIDALGYSSSIPGISYGRARVEQAHRILQVNERKELPTKRRKQGDSQLGDRPCAKNRSCILERPGGPAADGNAAPAAR